MLSKALQDKGLERLKSGVISIKALSTKAEARLSLRGGRRPASLESR